MLFLKEGIGVRRHGFGLISDLCHLIVQFTVTFKALVNLQNSPGPPLTKTAQSREKKFLE